MAARADNIVKYPPPDPHGAMVASASEAADTSASTNVAGNTVGRFRSDPLGFMLRLTSESSAFYTGAGWRAYQNYIGARIFYPEYASEIRNALLSSQRLSDAVRNVALARFRQLHSDIPPGSENWKKAARKHRNLSLEEVTVDTQVQLVKMMENMVADMSSISTIRFVAFFINSMLVRMYHQGIHIRESEFVELQKYARYAEANKMSLIFLPSHKSHVDYLVLSYIFYRLGIALPHIAAGDNLNMPVVGSILKAGGAFFIRRQWGDDVMYNVLMKEYIELLLTRGHNLEVFIEGTRSRIGKLLQPKFGILKIVLDAVAAGRVKDVILVPMSIGYDKVIETESYVNELLGTPKQKESLKGLLNSVNILQFKWGRIDIRFAKPYSLRQYIESQQVRRGATFQPMSVPEDRILLLQSLGFRVLSDINAVNVTMPTALVGTVVLTLRGRGVGRNELVRKVNWLKREILAKGGRVAHFGDMSTAAIVERAVQQMKDLIGKRTDLLEPVYYPLKRFELSFYRNQVIHLFLSEAILSTAMYATVKAGGPVHSQRIQLHPFLAEDVAFVSQLLKAEFIYGPGGLEKNLDETVERLRVAGVITVEEEERPPVAAIDGDGGRATTAPEDVVKWISLSPEERRIGRETFDFYCFLMWPFVETYWLAAVSLFSIIPDVPPTPTTGPDGQPAPPPLEWVDERIVMNRAQYLGKTLYYEGDLSYFESINKETLKNAMARFKDMGVILTVKSASQPAKFAPYIPQPAAASASSAPPPAAPASGPMITWVAIAPDYIPRDILPPLPDEVREHPPQGLRLDPGATLRESVKATATATAMREAAGVAAAEAYMAERESRTKSRAKQQHKHQHRAQHQQQQQQKQQDHPSVSPVSTALSFLGAPGDEEIHDAWHNIRPDSALWELCEQIGRFRREGKNRRDTATVAIRVLRLARIAAAWVDAKKGKAKLVKKKVSPPSASEKPAGAKPIPPKL
ncbi:hypothetical protein HDU87_005218 [Geranomyces variabilis]|uniref:Phospholipid/glycerol acyltransferase domain-containing protein n=1 Tax=Geranomyces variabilis TaxID=109894 RepID=A0AAD5TJP7_9FUNG|nr:hypothetical protein HDU87_005218 [Geranomyces variabilis]